MSQEDENMINAFIGIGKLILGIQDCFLSTYQRQKNYQLLNSIMELTAYFQKKSAKK